MHQHFFGVLMATTKGVFHRPSSPRKKLPWTMWNCGSNLIKIQIRRRFPSTEWCFHIIHDKVLQMLYIMYSFILINYFVDASTVSSKMQYFAKWCRWIYDSGISRSLNYFFVHIHFFLCFLCVFSPSTCSPLQHLKLSDKLDP